MAIKSSIPLKIEHEDKNVKITLNNIEKNVGIHDEEIKAFLRSRNIQALIVYHNKFVPTTANIKESRHTLELVIEELTRRWYEFESNDLDEFSPWLVSDFLDTVDFSHSVVTLEQSYDLEDFLARMLYHAVKNNPDTVSDEWFKTLFEKLRLQHVSSKTIGRLGNLPHCIRLRETYPKFSEKIIELFTFHALNLPKNGTNPFSTNYQ